MYVTIHYAFILIYPINKKLEVDNVGRMTVMLSDDVEYRLRTFIFRKYRGKGRRTSETIEEAIIEYLDLHESEVE